MTQQDNKHRGHIIEQTERLFDETADVQTLHSYKHIPNARFPDSQKFGFESAEGYTLFPADEARIVSLYLERPGLAMVILELYRQDEYFSREQDQKSYTGSDVASQHALLVPHDYDIPLVICNEQQLEDPLPPIDDVDVDPSDTSINTTRLTPQELVYSGFGEIIDADRGMAVARGLAQLSVSMPEQCR